MVDHELRRNLANTITGLQAGSTNGSFDDATYFRYASTDDRAVREIAVYCYSVFAPKSNGDSKSAGIESQSIKGLLGRSILFLQTELEYEWPPDSLIPSQRALLGLAIFMLLPSVIALAVMRLPIETIASLWFMFTFVLIAFVGTLVSLKLVAMKPAPTRIKSKLMSNRGDYGVWPFYRRGDHVLASRR